MRVSYVLPNLDVGGQERLVVSLGREMIRLGHEPHVVGLMGGGALERDLTAAGVPWTALVPSHRVPGYPAALLSHLRANPTDILHSHSGSWFPAAIAGALRRIPVLHTEHGRYPDEPWWTTTADRLAARFTSRIVVVSDRLQHEMRDRLGLAALPPLVRNGVEVPPPPSAASREAARRTLGLPDRAPVVGTVGRLVPAKDHALLLQAVARLSSSLPDVRCVIIGEGPLHGELEQQIAALGLAGRAHLAGSRADASQLVEAFDAFAMSSSTEGTPLAVLEALAAGRPVAATDVGGMGDLLRQADIGYLVPHGSPERLAGALGDLLSDPVGAMRRGGAGRALVEAKYSSRTCAEAYVELYRSICRA